MSTSNSPAPAATSGMAERIHKLAAQITLHESATNRATRMTGSIAVIALLLMCGYFYYGYVMIGGLLKPSMLVPYASGMLEQNLPSAREALAKQIKDSAPAWAEQVSLKAQGAIPELRTKLETYVLSKTDELAAKVTELTEEKFRNALQDNRELIDQGFKELASSKELSEETVQALVVALEQELKSDMQAQSKDVLETLRLLSKRVQRLAIGAGLDEEERCERRIAMIARRLQLSEADPRTDTASDTKKSNDGKAADADASGDKPAADEGSAPAKDEKRETKTGDESKS